MWRVPVLIATTTIGFAVGNHWWDAGVVGSVVGFVVGLLISFPRIIGEVAEGAVDCID